MNPYIEEIHLSLEQMDEENRTIDGLQLVVGGIVTSVVDLYGPNFTIGAEVRKVVEAYEVVRNELYQSTRGGDNFIVTDRGVTK